MSTTATPGEQPAATTVPEAGATPQTGAITETAFDGLTDEQALALIDGRTPAPTPAAESTPEPQVIEGVQPQETPVPEPEPEPKAKHAQRIRLTGLQEADQQKVTDALNLVREGKASDIATAMKMVAGEEAAPVEPQAEPEPEPTPEPPNLTELEERLAILRQERRAAKADYDNERDAELTDEIEDVLLSIQTAKLSERDQQGEMRSYNDQFAEAVAEVEQQYAHVFDTNPDFEELLDAYKAKAESSNDPIIQDPRYVIGLAEKAARVLGLSKTPATTLAPTPPARAAKPVGSTTAPGHTHRAVPTTDQILASIDQLSIEQLAALVDRK
jgi:hypothetical protein